MKRHAIVLHTYYHCCCHIIINRIHIILSLRCCTLTYAIHITCFHWSYCCQPLLLAFFRQLLPLSHHACPPLFLSYWLLCCYMLYIIVIKASWLLLACFLSSPSYAIHITCLYSYFNRRLLAAWIEYYIMLLATYFTYNFFMLFYHYILHHTHYWAVIHIMPYYTLYYTLLLPY